MTLMHSWLTLWPGFDGREVSTMSETRYGFHKMTQCADVTRTEFHFTSWKTEQTVRYFLKTYDTYAFMAN